MINKRRIYKIVQLYTIKCHVHMVRSLGKMIESEKKSMTNRAITMFDAYLQHYMYIQYEYVTRISK